MGSSVRKSDELLDSIRSIIGQLKHFYKSSLCMCFCFFFSVCYKANCFLLIGDTHELVKQI